MRSLSISSILLDVAVAVLTLHAANGAPAGTVAADAGMLTARVDGGLVEGAIEDGAITFKGIPFAAPPVGPLRWRPPQPVKPWRGVRRATGYGPDCMQARFPGDSAPLRTTPEEDCLYLNVWRPKAPAPHPLPVMVWIYGGGFVNGGSSPAEYDGSAFARDGVVLVSFNYRIGNFGFFAFPALTVEAQQKGEQIGNYAFMDQIAALKWIRRNIARFGGDAHNVTIFGESAGGMSVNVLLTTPLAAGLYQKAIMESGVTRPNMVLVSRPVSGDSGSAQAKGVALAGHFGIEGTGPDALGRLRGLPASKLAGNLNMATMFSDPTYVGGPIRDGKLLVDAPMRLYAAGQGARVPVIIGANSMDMSFLKAKSLPELYEQFGPDAAEARELYGSAPGLDLGPWKFESGSIEAVAFAVGGDQMMVEPARQAARLLSSHGQPVYEYRFSYVAQSLRKSVSGALHATELPFVFDTVAARYGKTATAPDLAMARSMHSYWVAFAKTGRPEPAGEPPWPAFQTAQDKLLNFTGQGPVAEADRRKARLDLVERASERREAAKNQ